MNNIVQRNSNRNISAQVLDRNDFRFDEKVYRYLCIDPKDHTDFDEIILDFIGSKNLPRTQIEYSADIRNFKDFFDMKTNGDLLEIRHQQAKKYVLELEHKKLSPTVIKRRISVMRGLYEWVKGYIEQYVDTGAKTIPNPFRLIKGPRVQQDIMATASLSEKEINELIASIQPEKNTGTALEIADRDRCMVLLHLSTGVRVSELVQAKLSSFQPYGEDNVVFRYISKGGEIKESVIEFRLYDRIQSYSDRYEI